jgi:hypothetical protein
LAITVPLWRYFRSPERQYALILDNLREGKPVQLLGSAGLPPHCELIVGGDSSVMRAGEDGEFCIDAVNNAMLEVLHDPQCSRYRMSLQVRLEQFPAKESEAGIYFGYELVDVSGKLAHRCFRLTLQSFYAIGQGKDQPLLARQKLKLYATHFFEPDYRQESVPFALGAIDFALPPPGQWNDLVLTVTPASVEVGFAGQRRVFSADKLFAGRARPPGQPPAPVFQLNPRGGLGFYVSEGTASYRNVVVEPIPENN